DDALDLDRHRVAVAVERLAERQPHPALADAVLLDVGFLLAVEAHADAAFERGGVVEAAARVAGQAVGRGVAHRLAPCGAGRGKRDEGDRINAGARGGRQHADGPAAVAAARSRPWTRPPRARPAPRAEGWLTPGTRGACTAGASWRRSFPHGVAVMNARHPF